MSAKVFVQCGKQTKSRKMIFLELFLYERNYLFFSEDVYYDYGGAQTYEYGKFIYYCDLCIFTFDLCHATMTFVISLLFVAMLSELLYCQLFP